MKKNVLGKGLNSLIPNYDNSNINYIFIDIDLICANINQPRKHFNDSTLNELSESIKIHGIIQPLIVSEFDNKYLIIAGERRYRAAKMINLKKLPCIIVEKSTSEILELSLIENIQRDDLNPIEEARAFKNLIDNFNITQERLSDRLSISRTAITNKLRLLNLSSIVQDYILNYDITEGHGKVLAGIKDEYLQLEISNKIIDEDLSVRETERIIQSLFSKSKDKNKDKVCSKNDIYINNLKLNLENYFGTKVSINTKKNKGNIQIEYYSTEDLNRILDLIYSKDM
ncbi:ParB/RepB/Spo0J family partition protein [Candidatus Arthromitus sp. SFB-rat-Yit]|uniref:ParB/RepB/Spo0J family partition protein n=1 Tax=Candidatus Arthromitus sp. SFB-rat-Yit TaxID=1041504 RepID=UPI000227A854|nr:ParB/RepB/Spo0J family partition protein [Candidatus Arthromitus sp. SFB-rat-Yit]BAK81899.1 putative spo0J [Candidatus Arthromitus sp. SFB-rat-Yit]